MPRLQPGSPTMSTKQQPAERNRIPIPAPENSKQTSSDKNADNAGDGIENEQLDSELDQEIDDETLI